MVLYLISVGLSVTMGMMGFVNLAHGVFAMLGGYVMTNLMTRFGMPFVPALAMGAAATALGSIVIERLLYRRLYGGDELDQVLLTNCTFDGVVYDVERVMEECLAITPDLIFLWDEAWFAFARFHPTYRRR